MTTCADTKKSSWVFVDATVFAVFAGLSEDIWSQTVSGFLDYSLGGAARIESATLTSSATRSFLMVAPTPTVYRGLTRVLVRKVTLTEFRDGYVTGLLLALPVVQALMSRERSPRNLAPRGSQLSLEQAVGLKRLLSAAESHLSTCPRNAGGTAFAGTRIAT